ncbi:MAG: Rpn family recombination-promoting nuclease/putative transposase, partial [Succiniclasticum sp.]|uniref:Rpn family recombination-promoting nuclease/putative transposase n=1 Tax=Succiniclasticum sp. TaxID=2775030 RepID=UPI002A909B09
EKGEKYSALNRTVVISILSYNLFPDEVWPEYHSSFAVLNTKDLKHKLTDDLEIHFIELPKWHKGDIEKMNRLEHWLAYLSPKTTNEERRRLAMKDPAIQKVMEAEKVFLADPDCITAYEQHEKYLRDMAAMKEYDEEVGWERGHAAGLTEGRAAGLAEGRAAGLAEGEMRAKESLIIKCHRNHMPVSDIAKLFEIDEEEVNRIILQNTDAAVES